MTEAGLHLAYKIAEPYIPGKLQIQKLKGSLLGPIEFNAFDFELDGLRIQSGKVSMEWTLAAVLAANINIDRLQISELTISLPKTEESVNETLPELYLPWRLLVKNAIIDQLSISKNKQTYNIYNVQLRASSLFHQIDIQQLDFNIDPLRISVTGNIALTKAYQHKLDFKWNHQPRASPANIAFGNGKITGDVKLTSIKHFISQPVSASQTMQVDNLFGDLKWQSKLDIHSVDFKIINLSKPPIINKFILDGAGDQYSGSFAGNLIVSYKDINQPINLEIKSKINWQNTGIMIKQFLMTSGKSNIHIQGEIADTLKLKWSAAIADFSTFHPHATGKLRMTGDAIGNPSYPIIHIDFNGSKLSLPAYALDELTCSVSVDLFRWKKTDLKFKAKSLSINNYKINSFEVSGNQSHIVGKLAAADISAFIEVKGGYFDTRWHGKIIKTDIISRPYANWKLKAPATLIIKENTLDLESFCILDNTASTICASVQKKAMTWRSQFNVSKVPLTILTNFLPPDLVIDGLLNATGSVQLFNTPQLYGDIKIQLPAGTVNYPVQEGGHAKWNYRASLATIDFNQQGIKVHANIDATNGDKLDFKAELPGAQLLTLDIQRQQIIADAKYDIHNLGLIEAFIPEVQDLKGNALLNVSVSGTLAKPAINGEARLQDGSLRIPRLGLTINKVIANGKMDRNNNFNFQLDAWSGDGHLVLKGKTRLDSAAGWPTDLSIKGEQFEVIKIPEARVLVSPDLLVTMKKSTIDVKGKIIIPYAKLQPKDISTAARVSSDAVIIGDEQQSEQKWSIFTRIQLGLGERVTFYGFGFEGRFGGNLILQDEPGQPSIGIGEITIPEGQYRAYGQNLKVENGKLLYTGGPIMNPGLDLRAVRKIGNITAGLKVRGSLSKPIIELFSIPAMGQTDTLAYLLLGGPIEKASGEQGEMMAKAALAIGLSGGDSLARALTERFGLDEMRVESNDKGDKASLVLGRYLSPKLYVSYGVGLVESANTVNIRYQISDKWQLKGESGEHQGADLLFTIDRD